MCGAQIDGFSFVDPLNLVLSFGGGNRIGVHDMEETELFLDVELM
jgi:hypothetical protein